MFLKSDLHDLPQSFFQDALDKGLCFLSFSILSAFCSQRIWVNGCTGCIFSRTDDSVIHYLRSVSRSAIIFSIFFLILLVFSLTQIYKNKWVLIFSRSVFTFTKFVPKLRVWSLEKIAMQVIRSYENKRWSHTISETVACRGLAMPGATAWLDAPYQILVLSSGVRWSL